MQTRFLASLGVPEILTILYEIGKSISYLSFRLPRTATLLLRTMEHTHLERTLSRAGGLQNEGKHTNGEAPSNCAPGIGETLCLISKPLLDGYRMPAEWEEHER